MVEAEPKLNKELFLEMAYGLYKSINSINKRRNIQNLSKIYTYLLKIIIIEITLILWLISLQLINTKILKKLFYILKFSMTNNINMLNKKISIKSTLKNF